MMAALHVAALEHHFTRRKPAPVGLQEIGIHLQPCDPSGREGIGEDLLGSPQRSPLGLRHHPVQADATHAERITVRGERHSAVRVREGLDHCQASGGPPADGSTIERRRDARGIEEHVGNVFMHRAEVASRELPSQLGERLGAAGICAGLYVEFEPDDADLVRALRCLVDVETEGTSEPAASRRTDIVVGVEAHGIVLPLQAFTAVGQR